MHASGQQFAVNCLRICSFGLSILQATDANCLDLEDSNLRKFCSRSFILTRAKDHQTCSTRFLYWTNGSTLLQTATERSVDRTALVTFVPTRAGQDVYHIKTMSGFLGLDSNGNLIHEKQVR